MMEFDGNREIILTQLSLVTSSSSDFPLEKLSTFFLKGAAYDRTYDTFQVIICHHLLVTTFKMQAHRGHDTRDFPREA